MIKISHRGNLEGPVKELENCPKQIQKVLKKGFNCEIDVWYTNSNLILAHDLKSDKNYKINDQFLLQKGLWCHAKNFGALNYLKKLGVNFFWHEEDKISIWYPKIKIFRQDKDGSWNSAISELKEALKGVLNE